MGHGGHGILLATTRCIASGQHLSGSLISGQPYTSPHECSRLISFTMTTRFVDIAALLGFAGGAVLYGIVELHSSDCSSLMPNRKHAGINVVMFFLSMSFILSCQWRRRNTSLVLIFLNPLLFASCSAHFALQFAHFYITLVRTCPIDYL